MQFAIQIVPFLLIFAVFWFFLIRPQKKQQQEHQEMLDNLKIGDKVVTIGGIKGKIIKLKDDYIRLRLSSTVDVDVIKSAIGRLDKSETEKKDKE